MIPEKNYIPFQLCFRYCGNSAPFDAKDRNRLNGDDAGCITDRTKPMSVGSSQESCALKRKVRGKSDDWHTKTVEVTSVPLYWYLY